MWTNVHPGDNEKWAPDGIPIWGPESSLYRTHIGPLPQCWRGILGVEYSSLVIKINVERGDLKFKLNLNRTPALRVKEKS